MTGTTTYYYSEMHNYACMISAKNVITFYQVKFYALSGETRHQYGKQITPTVEYLKQLYTDLQESTQEEFFRTAINYYAKEKENAALFKQHYEKHRNPTT